MFRKKTDVGEPGFSLGSVLTGLIVAFGSMMVAGMIAGALASLTGATSAGLDAPSVQMGIAAVIGFLLVQLLSYMWGGYTAGRMAGGSGVLNGFMVPTFALLLGGIVALVAVTTGAVDTRFIPEGTDSLVAGLDIARAGTVVGLASVALMFLGGLLGGSMGARRQLVTHETRTESSRVIDLREDTKTPVTH